LRIFFASDLHYDAERGRDAVHAMASWLEEHATTEDLLILGGDYGNDDAMVAACLECFADVDSPTFGVSGNHDIWTEGDDGRTSHDRWLDLQSILRDHGVHPLEADPVSVHGVGLCGGLGWYDYTFRSPALDIDPEVYRDKRLPQYQQPIWKDAFLAKWGLTDPEVTEWQLRRLEADLETLARRGHDRIVVVTHHVPSRLLLRPDKLPDYLPRHHVIPEKWLVLNTYLGSQRFAELIGNFAPRIEVAFCGHIHLARQVHDYGVTFASNGSTYEDKELMIWEDGKLRRRTFG
jgi:3',5'-cyclic AMP phosphodiesterase CpdA